MKNTNDIKNLKVKAEGLSKGGFVVYLEMPSGEREFIMAHRKNKPLFDLLKCGMPLGELQCMSLERGFTAFTRSRDKHARNRANQLSSSFSHLSKAVEFYLKYRDKELMFGSDELIA